MSRISYSNLESDFCKFLIEKFNAKVDEDSLDITFNDLRLDSLDLVDVMLWAEEKYDINLNFRETDIGKLNTAREFVDLVYDVLNK